MLKPEVLEDVLGPTVNGAMLISVAHVTTEGHADVSGLYRHLKPCCCERPMMTTEEDMLMSTVCTTTGDHAKVHGIVLSTETMWKVREPCPIDCEVLPVKCTEV